MAALQSGAKDYVDTARQLLVCQFCFRFCACCSKLLAVMMMVVGAFVVDVVVDRRST
jgi:hypothetical protein